MKKKRLVWETMNANQLFKQMNTEVWQRVENICSWHHAHVWSFVRILSPLEQIENVFLVHKARRRNEFIYFIEYRVNLLIGILMVVPAVIDFVIGHCCFAFVYVLRFYID